MDEEQKVCVVGVWGGRKCVLVVVGDPAEREQVCVGGGGGGQVYGREGAGECLWWWCWWGARAGFRRAELLPRQHPRLRVAHLPACERGVTARGCVGAGRGGAKERGRGGEGIV